ncbi:unnamed protein product [Heterosigma akashiwo]
MSYLGLIGLPEQCTQAFGDIFNKECGMILVSKLLGLAMIAGSVLLKVPQIQNIVSSGSVEGLAPMSFYSEVLLFVFSVIYNFQMGFPISSYGESISVLIQNIILVFLVWEYMKPPISTGKKASVASLLLLISVLAYNVPPAQPLAGALQPAHDTGGARAPDPDEPPQRAHGPAGARHHPALRGRRRRARAHHTGGVRRGSAPAGELPGRLRPEHHPADPDFLVLKGNC